MLAALLRRTLAPPAPALLSGRLPAAPVPSRLPPPPLALAATPRRTFSALAAAAASGAPRRGPARSWLATPSPAAHPPSSSSALLFSPPLTGSVRHTSVRLKSLKQRPRLTPICGKRHGRHLIPRGSWHIWERDRVEISHYGEVIGEGSVKKVLMASNQLIIDGFNLQTAKRTKRGANGGRETVTVTEEMPVPYSMCHLLDPTSGKPTKVKLASLAAPGGGTRRVRLSKRSGAVIPRVKHEPKLAYQERIEAIKYSERTTRRGDVLQRTYIQE